MSETHFGRDAASGKDARAGDDSQNEHGCRRRTWNRYSVVTNVSKASTARAASHQSASGDAHAAEELQAFVRDESLKARPGERLPGTTEVLESCFGKLKSLEEDQSKSGFTGFVLSLCAVLSPTTAEVVWQALESSRTKDVLNSYY